MAKYFIPVLIDLISDREVFIFVYKPFDSWTYSSATKQYEPPIVRPEGNYAWNEAEYQADNTKGWVEVGL